MTFKRVICGSSSSDVDLPVLRQPHQTDINRNKPVKTSRNRLVVIIDFFFKVLKKVIGLGGYSRTQRIRCRKLMCCHGVGPVTWMCEGVVSWCVVTGWDQQSGCVRVWYAGVISRGGASSVDVRVCRKLVRCHGMGPEMWMYEGVVS